MGTATAAHPTKRPVVDREAFKQKFGHPYSSGSIGGHLFYGYNCSKCGIHISLARPTRWLKAEHKGSFPGVELPEFAGLRAGVLG